MSTSHSTVPLPETQKPEFYSPRAGAHLAGVSPQTLRRRATPDAWLRSDSGKSYPLYRRETLEAWAAEREAQGGAE